MQSSVRDSVLSTPSLTDDASYANNWRGISFCEAPVAITIDCWRLNTESRGKNDKRSELVGLNQLISRLNLLYAPKKSNSRSYDLHAKEKQCWKLKFSLIDWHESHDSQNKLVGRLVKSNNVLFESLEGNAKNKKCPSEAQTTGWKSGSLVLPNTAMKKV